MGKILFVISFSISLISYGQDSPQEPIYAGEKKSIKNGADTVFYNSQVIKSIINYNSGKREGKSKWFHRNGTISSTANYIDGKENGLSIWYDEDGNKKSQGEYKDDLMVGNHQWFYPNGTIKKEIPYTNNVVAGYLKQYNENGVLTDKHMYQNSKKNGPYEIYYPNGNINGKGTYLNDVLDGEVLEYHLSGQLYLKGQFVEGKKEGRFELFDTNGNATEVIDFEHDIEVNRNGLIEGFNSLANKGMESSFTSDHKNTIEIMEKALQAASKENIKMTSQLGGVYYHLGRSQYKLGKYKEAEFNYLKAIEIFLHLEGEFGFNFSRMCHNLATIYLDIGDYGKSELYFNKAIIARKNNSAATGFDVASSKTGLGSLYYSTNRYNEAKEIFEEVLSFYEDNLEPNHELVLQLKGKIAGVPNKNAGVYAELTEHLEVLNSYLENDIKKNEYYIETCLNIAMLYVRQNMLNEASIYVVEGLNTYDSLNLNDPSILAYLIEVKAYIHYKDKEFEKAKKAYQLALNIRKHTTGPQNKSYISSYFKYGEILLELGETQEAAQVLVSATRRSLGNMVTNSTSLLRKDRKELYANQRLVINDFLVKFKELHKQVPELSAELFDLILNFKFSLLRSNINFKNWANNSQDSKVRQLYEEWLRVQDNIGWAYNTGVLAHAEGATLLDRSLPLSYEIERELLDKYNPDLNSLNEVSWKEIRALLKPGEAVVEIIRSIDFGQNQNDEDYFYVILIVRADSIDAPEVIVLNDAERMDTSGRTSFGEYISKRLSPEDSEDFYGLYWSKMAEKLEGIDKVYLSADGAYNNISLNSLYNFTTDKYLGEEITINLIYGSASMLPDNSINNHVNESVLVGNINYEFEGGAESFDRSANVGIKSFMGPSNYISSFFRANISPLPETAKEIRAIEAILNEKGLPVRLIEDTLALEKDIKAIKSPYIMHYATHAFYQDWQSHSYSVDEDGIIIFSYGVPFEDDLLLRSGLVLTGGSNAWVGGGDGILSAFEASHLNLINTELVVLSACETGLGINSQGEGIIGLGSAFFEAGAKNVLTSLWKIDDEVTNRFMTNFYHNWLVEGQTKNQALLNAQETIRNTPGYSSPYYWGAFVLIGI